MTGSLIKPQQLALPLPAATRFAPSGRPDENGRNPPVVAAGTKALPSDLAAPVDPLAIPDFLRRA